MEKQNTKARLLLLMLLLVSRQGLLVPLSASCSSSSCLCYVFVSVAGAAVGFAKRGRDEQNGVTNGANTAKWREKGVVGTRRTQEKGETMMKKKAYNET